MKTKSLEITSEELKLIFNSIRYFQMFKAAYDSKEYHLCQTMLNRLYEDMNSIWKST